MPGEVEGAVAVGNPDGIELGVEFAQAHERAREAFRCAQDADVVPHAFVQGLAHRFQACGRAREWRFGCGDGTRNRVFIRRSPCAVRPDPRSHAVAGNAAEHRGIGHAIAAQAIGAVYPAGVFARREQARERGRAVGGKLHAAHHVMRGRHHLDQAAGEIETAVCAALDHALELSAHILGSQVAHRDVEPAVGRDVAGAHLGLHGARDDVAGGPLGALVVLVHEALLVAAQEVAAGPAQAFLDDGTGDARARPRQHPGGMKLHHLHVAQGQARRQGHGHAVATFVARRRVVLVHGRPAAGGQ